jgi:general stress protein 26
MEEQTQKLHSLLENFEVAMLVTHAGDKMHARPMVIAHVDDNCNLWFISSRNTPKVVEILNDQQVQIVCQRDSHLGISISGKALLVEDPARVREFWKPSFQAWFPKGPSDPDIILIQVRGEEAEYWDNKGLEGIRYYFNAFRAYVHGTTPQLQEGKEHGRVNLAA